MKKIKIKDIVIPTNRWSMIAILEKKNKNILYLDGEEVGRVKNYEEAKKWIVQTYRITGVTLADNLFSCWTEGKRI